MRPSTTVCCTIVLGAILAGGANASTTPAGPQSATPKADSFAPHPGSRQHAYGTPIQSPILHRRRPALHTHPIGAAHGPKTTTS